MSWNCAAAVASMGITFAGISLFSVQFAVLGPIISFALAIALFGFYTLLFGLSCYLLHKNRNIGHRKLHLTWTIALFFISTLGGLINAASGLDDLVVAYTALLTQDADPFFDFLSQSKRETVMVGLAYTCMILTNAIADSVLIHRIYLVWGSNIWIATFPILASLAVNVEGLAATIMRTKGFSNSAIPANYTLELKGVNYHLGFYYANAALNLLYTLMIAGRIWWMGVRTSKSFGQERTINKRYKQIILVLIECGMIYPLTLIAHAALEGTTERISIPVNLTPTVMEMAGIAPTLIILHTCLGRTISQKVIDSQNTAFSTSSMKYSSKQRSGPMGGKNISSLVNFQTASHNESVGQSEHIAEVAIEMKRITAEVAWLNVGAKQATTPSLVYMTSAKAQAAKDKPSRGNTRHYTQAILEDSSDWTFPLNRAAAYLKLGKNEDAERDCTSVLNLNKSNVKALFRRAQARRALGKLDDAQKHLELAASLDSSNERRVPIKIIEPPTKTKPAPSPSPTRSSTSTREATVKEKPSSITRTISKPNVVSTPTSRSPATSTVATPHPPSTVPPPSSSSPASLSSSSSSVPKSPPVVPAAAPKLAAEAPKAAAEPEPSTSSTSLPHDILPTSQTRARRKRVQGQPQEVVGDGNGGESSSPAALEDNVNYCWGSGVSLGTKISTLFEFTRGWDRLAQQGGEELARKAIGPYPTKFQNSLEPPVLMRIFKTFRAALDENSPNSSLYSSASASVSPAAAQNQAYTNVTSLITTVLQVLLQALLQVCRIHTVAMFLRSGEREMMRGVVGEVFRASERGLDGDGEKDRDTWLGMSMNFWSVRMVGECGKCWRMDCLGWDGIWTLDLGIWIGALEGEIGLDGYVVYWIASHLSGGLIGVDSAEAYPVTYTAGPDYASAPPENSRESSASAGSLVGITTPTVIDRHSTPRAGFQYTYTPTTGLNSLLFNVCRN
ncbi:hypothetical protein GYMLUDRAFT_239358 [Collybiopsis luxurians FD-317 M1]|nr:hypothetical protein GYMLUDRAFT_239358 [Collybiopsis luxurians FD-317 M1]